MASMPERLGSAVVLSRPLGADPMPETYSSKFRNLAHTAVAQVPFHIGLYTVSNPVENDNGSRGGRRRRSTS